MWSEAPPVHGGLLQQQQRANSGAPVVAGRCTVPALCMGVGLVGRSLFLPCWHIQGQLLSCTVYLHHLQLWDRACLPVGQGTRSFTLGLNAASTAGKS